MATDTRLKLLHNLDCFFSFCSSTNILKEGSALSTSLPCLRLAPQASKTVPGQHSAVTNHSLQGQPRLHHQCSPVLHSAVSQWPISLPFMMRPLYNADVVDHSLLLETLSRASSPPCSDGISLVPWIHAPVNKGCPKIWSRVLFFFSLFLCLFQHLN